MVSSKGKGAAGGAAGGAVAAKKKVNNKKSSAPLKVQRQPATNKTVISSTKKAKPLPQDWPVTSKPPSISSEHSALRPGSLLQEKCSGLDIHLNRQTLIAPSIAKEKGRYLLILPGTFSFKTINAGDTSSSTGKEDAVAASTIHDGDDDAAHNDDDDDNNEEEEEDEGDDPKSVSAFNKSVLPIHKPTTTAVAVPQFGNIQGLSTPNPKLRIAFPRGESGHGRSLVFPGTKVETSSKYLWLNCSAKKKGTVACKVRTDKCGIQKEIPSPSSIHLCF